MTFHNPYSGLNFFQFFWEFIKRLFGFLTGQFAFADLVSDEIQILVLVGVAISAALVGTFLVLRRMTMLANSLSHTILLGVVFAFLLSRTHMGHFEGQLNIQAMLIGAFAMGIITTFLTEFLTRTVRLQEDASTGLVFTTLFAAGIILVTLLTRNAHVGTEVVMGNVDALHIDDCKLIFAILAINVVVFTLFFKEFKLTTFDPGLSKALGFSTVFYNYLLMTQVSATAIGAFRAVGVFMVLAFITGPVLTARLLTHDLKTMIFLAMGIGSLAALVGVALSRHLLSVYGLPLSTAGIVVCVILLFFMLGVLKYYYDRRQGDDGALMCVRG